MIKKLPKLLNNGNAKTSKGEKLGWMTYGLHLAPFNLSGFNVCCDASEGCAAACLNTAGRGAMSNVQQSRIAKTKRFFEDKDLFVWTLAKEIQACIKSAERKGMKACFRLNLTSDLPWEKIKVLSHGKKLSLMEMFPDVQFYDYTKIPTRKVSDYKNYHLTWSYSEANMKYANWFDKIAYNIAVVFNGDMPIHFKGREVINGDETDLRFLDKQNVIVGLKAKGKAS